MLRGFDSVVDGWGVEEISIGVFVKVVRIKDGGRNRGNV